MNIIDIIFIVLLLGTCINIYITIYGLNFLSKKIKKCQLTKK